MRIDSRLPAWLRKKPVWIGLGVLYAVLLVIYLIFGRFWGPYALRAWLMHGFLRTHLGKISAILLGILSVFFLWIADRVFASPEDAQPTRGAPPKPTRSKQVLHLLFAAGMVAIACWTIYETIMFGQSVHLWFTEDKAWWEANKHLFD